MGTKIDGDRIDGLGLVVEKLLPDSLVTLDFSPDVEGYLAATMTLKPTMEKDKVLVWGGPLGWDEDRPVECLLVGAPLDHTGMSVQAGTVVERHGLILRYFEAQLKVDQLADKEPVHRLSEGDDETKVYWSEIMAWTENEADKEMVKKHLGWQWLVTPPVIEIKIRMPLMPI